MKTPECFASSGLSKPCGMKQSRGSGILPPAIDEAKSVKAMSEPSRAYSLLEILKINGETHEEN